MCVCAVTVTPVYSCNASRETLIWTSTDKYFTGPLAVTGPYNPPPYGAAGWNTSTPAGLKNLLHFSFLTSFPFSVSVGSQRLKKGKRGHLLPFDLQGFFLVVQSEIPIRISTISPGQRRSRREIQMGVFCYCHHLQRFVCVFRMQCIFSPGCHNSFKAVIMKIAALHFSVFHIIITLSRPAK